MHVTLALYIGGDTALSRRAVANMRRLTSDYFSDGVRLDVIDVTRDPEQAEAKRILATPTLIRVAPGPERRVTGDLSDAERVLAVLHLNDDFIE